MEELLNKLIEKGRKPREEDVKVLNTGVNTFNERVVRFKTNKGWFKSWWWTYRELVSKESWLWRFVAYKKMVDKEKIWRYYEMILDDNWIDAKDYRPFWLEERLIIESALIDESELEGFLLSNIKIEW